MKPSNAQRLNWTHWGLKRSLGLPLSTRSGKVYFPHFLVEWYSHRDKYATWDHKLKTGYHFTKLCWATKIRWLWRNLFSYPQHRTTGDSVSLYTSGVSWSHPWSPNSCLREGRKLLPHFHRSSRLHGPIYWSWNEVYLESQAQVNFSQSGGTGWHCLLVDLLPDWSPSKL